jgi:hypothetical protein
LGTGVLEVSTVSSGDNFTFSFTVATGYNPAVTVNGASVTLGTPDNTGLYSHTVTSITAATAISIAAIPAGSSDGISVILTKGDNVTLGESVQDVSTVASGGSFTFSFTVPTGYQPTLTVNNEPVTLGAPDNTGLYSHTITNITAATTINITAQQRLVEVTVERELGKIILGSSLTAGVKKIAYGSNFAFSFTVVEEGYLPVLKVNDVEVTLGAQDANGYYSHTVTNITVATTISIATKSSGEGPTGVGTLAADAPRFYPNPADNVVTFVNTEKVSIYAVSGTLLGVYTEATISIAHLPAGIYVVKMQRGSYTRTVRLVKN